jgi:hypothetical protein
VLYRRFILASHVRRNGTLSSGVYMRSDGKVDALASVELGRLTTIQDLLARAPNKGVGYGVAALTVGDARGLHLTVVPDPLCESRAHCEIRGLRSKTDCNKLAELTRIIYPPPPA